MSFKKKLHIALVAGEASGDTLGAGLMQALKESVPDIMFSGIGGEKMLTLGLKPLAPIDTLSVMGLIDVFKNYFKLKKLRQSIVDHYLSNPPDVYIGIDLPDFNLFIEKQLKSANIKTAHYVSPQVWAWREHRIPFIREAVDKLLCLFPFETEFHKKHRIHADFVGHPLACKDYSEKNVGAIRRLVTNDQSSHVIAVLPGSRLSDIKHMAKTFLETCELLSRQRQSLVFVIPAVNKTIKNTIDSLIQQGNLQASFHVTLKPVNDVLMAADYALVKSGTGSLEAMLYGVPMVVAYKSDWLTYKLATPKVKIPNKSLPNILAKKRVVEEFIQYEATPTNLCDAMLRLIDNDNSGLKEIFAFLSQSLKADTNHLAAQSILSLCAL